MAIASTEMASVRYLVDDVARATDFYTSHLGFVLGHNAAPAFAEVTRGSLRLLLSGPTSSGARPMPDGATPVPGGWNRIHLIVDDITAEVARLRAAGLTFRNDIVKGPGGQQILLLDPAGNPVELFQPAGR
ncbi:glyoxalase [Mycobacterium sp. IS-2888]|uniref:VOC family protein n=1 Tax=Mycobacterium sp. IS-2888 TaxID=1834159 RepID=UPI00096FDCA9|nr:VOC family protein [Mycobacterium sp. IS-2888]OMC54090.1 glyoxalase [Mycobacterium sp. IS-2888]